MRNEIDKIFDDNLSAYSSAIPEGTWQAIEGQIVSTRSNRRWLWLLLAFIGISFIAIFLLYPALSKGHLEEDNNLPDQEIPILAKINNDVDQNVAEREEVEAEMDKAYDNNLENSQSGRTVHDSQNTIKKLTDSSPVNKKQNNYTEKIDLFNTESGSELKNSERNTLDNAKLGKELPSNIRYNENIKLCEPDFLKRHLYEVVGEGNNKGLSDKTLGDCFEGPPEKWLVALTTSLDFPFRKLTAINQSEFGKYVEERENTESELLSFNLGVQLGYIHPSGLLLKSGAQYTHINERFLFIKENVIKIQTQITIDTMYNPDGSFTINRDTTVNEVYGREEMKTINQYRMLDIPLIVGYKFDKGKFSIELNAGVIFNISSQTSGRIFNSDLVPVHYGTRGTGNFNPYKIRFGTSIYGGATILTNFWGRSQFFFEPNARYYLKSFSHETYPINQKYFVLGISAGIRYYF